MLSTTPGTQYELIQVYCVMNIFVIILIIIAHEARLDNRLILPGTLSAAQGMKSHTKK